MSCVSLSCIYDKDALSDDEAPCTIPLSREEVAERETGERERNPVTSTSIKTKQNSHFTHRIGENWSFGWIFLVVSFARKRAI